MIALFLLVSCVASVWSQDSLVVRWNNSVFINSSTDLREVIYHDEIVLKTSGFTDPDGPGILICSVFTLDSFAGWRRPDFTFIATDSLNNDFTQFRSRLFSTRVQLARARDPLQDGASNNGLWTCSGGGHPPRYVALYNRGNGQLNNVAVSLQQASFESNTFTLAADTTGGPPTTFSWTRNDETALTTNDNSYSISRPVADPNNNQNDRENCLYRSALQVTGNFPGVYKYSASNRATSGNAMGSFTVEGGDPSNLQVVQTGLNMVELTWDPPPGPPARGYQVQFTGSNFRTTTDTNLVIDRVPLGENSFQVTSLSQHFPQGSVGPETITIRGAFPPVLTLSELTATSVRVSWSSPPMFSFTVTTYEVSVIRTTNCSSVTVRRGPRRTNADAQTQVFDGLEEYITYRAEITAIFQSPSSSFTVPPATTEMEFTTMAISPSEIPRNVVPIITSRTISVSWDTINCGNQNGPNFHYEVEFRQMDGRAAPVGTVNNVMFTVEGLQPFTNYTFRVRGVNVAGNGDYTGLIIIQTDQDIPGIAAGFSSRLRTFTSVLVTWRPPQEPNGIIIMYELTYLLNETISMSENITNRLNYTIESVVNTRIEVRVRAYTIVGPGPIVTTSITLSPPIVMNVQVESLTDTSVVVSWELTDIPDIVEYIVYYAPLFQHDKEQSVIVPRTENSLIITGLESRIEYQYQVTIVTINNRQRIQGERSSPVTDITRLIVECINCDLTIPVSVSVVVSVLLTIVLYSALLLAGCYIVRAQHSNHSKNHTADAGGMAMKENEAYSQVTSTVGMAMNENAAYGPVTSSQQPQDYIYAQPDVKTESEYDVVK